MNKHFTFIFVASLLLMIAEIMNAQDVQNPWHLIAHENDAEVAFYNTEVITGIEATTQNVTIVLDNGKEFSHPLATTVFSFDPRREGTGTAKENITVPQWNIHYVNDRLYFSEIVSDIAVYTVSGVLVAQLAGSHLEIPIRLMSGIYIVHTQGKSAKLVVGANRNVGAVTQSANEAQTAAYSPTPISLRSDNGIKVYWNITASNSKMSVEIPNVVKFYFTTDNSIIFTLKNGNTVELTDYQGVEFSIEPVLIENSQWDLEKTITIGGGSYGDNGNYVYPMDVKSEFIAVLTKTEIIFYDVSSKKENNYLRSGSVNALINLDKISLSTALQYSYIEPPEGCEAVISFVIRDDDWFGSQPCISYVAKRYDGSERILFCGLYYHAGHQGHFWLDAPTSTYSFNSGTNKIASTFKTNADGSLTVSYINSDGNTQQYTFKK